MEKRGQLTVFVIIAVIIIAAAAAVFVYRDALFADEISANVEPVYTSFLSCVEDKAFAGIDILETQGGYIELPELEVGSVHSPFSSQFNFLGNLIPYWYYISGNGLPKENIPSRRDMEESLADFISDEIADCRFDSYYLQGFEISRGLASADIFISDKSVEVQLDMSLAIAKGNESALISNHNVIVKSNLGGLYNSARKVYEFEQENLFLENYAIDVMRLYAPVDGVELSCSPKIWGADEVFDNLAEAIEANTLAIKSRGGDFSLQNPEDKYFVQDFGVDEDVRIINSRNWPSSFEVNPSDEAVMAANPVGNQPGMGILGFCYVVYHFVYNLRYPVLVQVQSGDEIFQFPMAVVIEGNKPREALDTSAAAIDLPELCQYKNNLVSVNVYDTRLNSLEADISYECFGTRCEIGKTSITGGLEENFPQCVNGQVVARAEGFKTGRELLSTTSAASADIILDKLYNLEIDLKLDGKQYNRDALISFVSDDFSKTIVYPEQFSVNLSEGQYEIQVFVYRNSTLKLEETVREQCMDVPQSGLGSFFGLTDEKCFDIVIPSQIISNALAGGGKIQHYMPESELAGASVIEINAEGLPIPGSLEQLQDNYILFEEKKLDIKFAAAN